MAASSSSLKKVTLKSSDGESFELEECAALKSQTIKQLMEDGCSGEFIPLPNVKGKVLAKVIEYCKKHAETTPKSNGKEKDEDETEKKKNEEFKKWDEEYMKIGTDDLYDILMASNYLDIADLLNLAAQTTADLIKGKTPEEIRKTFGIKNDFSPEEEAEIRRENQWAFE